MALHPIKDKLAAQAALYAPLTALLGTNPMRWWNVQLRQGAVFPAVVVMIISDPQTYAYGGALPTSFIRVQFTAWDTSPTRLEQLDDALQAFIAQFNGAGLPNAPAQANFVTNRRDGFFPSPQQPVYQRMLDTKIFSNQTVS